MPKRIANTVILVLFSFLYSFRSQKEEEKKERKKALTLPIDNFLMRDSFPLHLEFQ